MLSHVCVGASDIARATAFFGAVLAPLGIRLRFTDPAGAFVTFEGPGGGRPLLFVGKPYDGREPAVGNGQMIAFQAASRDAVDRCHAAALAAGGSDEGPPGLRPHYHPNYYGAYFRDLDGAKFCVACHDPM